MPEQQPKRPSPTHIRVHPDVYEAIRSAAYHSRVKMPEIIRRAMQAYQAIQRKPKQ